MTNVRYSYSSDDMKSFIGVVKGADVLFCFTTVQHNNTCQSFTSLTLCERVRSLETPRVSGRVDPPELEHESRTIGHDGFR